MSLDPAELARLHKFVGAHTEKFALALVRVPQLDVREELREWAASVAGELGRGLVVIDGKGRTWREVWDQIAAGSQPGDVVVLTGLDELLRAEGGDLAKLLNRQRETIGRLLPGPVLWLIGGVALDRLVVEAPDLVDWYAAGFEFERDVQGLPLSRSDVRQEGTGHFSLSFLQKRIAVLRQQLETVNLADEVAVKIWLQLAQLHLLAVPAVPEGAERQAALDSARMAEHLLRKLPQQDRRTADQLGEALRIEAHLLEDVEAREKAEEAVAIYRRLASQSSSFQAKLGQSLLDLSRQVDWTTAADLESEAVALLRKSGTPADLLPALISHSVTMAAINRNAEALSIAKEAVTICSGLETRPDLKAHALGAYAAILSRTGDAERALLVMQEALELWQKLRGVQPFVLYEPALGFASASYEALRSDLGRLADAHLTKRNQPLAADDHSPS